MIAVDKEEAAVDLTKENAHRYEPTYHPFLVNHCLRKTRSHQYLDVFITTRNGIFFNCLSSQSV